MRLAALALLYRQLKQSKVALSRAEERQNNWEERINLQQKIDTLEWIISIVLEKGD